MMNNHKTRFVSVIALFLTIALFTEQAFGYEKPGVAGPGRQQIKCEIWDHFDHDPELIDDPTFLKHFRATCARKDYYLKKQGDSYEIFSGQTGKVVEIEKEWLKKALIEKMLAMDIEVRDSEETE